MPIVAGDIRATMTLDASKFSDGVAQAQSGLSTLEAGGTRVSNAYASVESRLGQSRRGDRRLHAAGGHEQPETA